MDVSLVMFKADGSSREFPLENTRTVIGRKNTCDLRVPLTAISRQHCEIKLNGKHAVLRDLGSSNGTYHNGERVTEKVLSAGDRIQIGPVVFTVIIDGEPHSVDPSATLIEQARIMDQAVAGKVTEHLPDNLEKVAEPEPIEELEQVDELEVADELEEVPEIHDADELEEVDESEVLEMEDHSPAAVTEEVAPDDALAGLADATSEADQEEEAFPFLDDEAPTAEQPISDFAEPESEGALPLADEEAVEEETPEVVDEAPQVVEEEPEVVESEDDAFDLASDPEPVEQDQLGGTLMAELDDEDEDDAFGSLDVNAPVATEPAPATDEVDPLAALKALASEHDGSEAPVDNGAQESGELVLDTDPLDDLEEEADNADTGAALVLDDDEEPQVIQNHHVPAEEEPGVLDEVIEPEPEAEIEEDDELDPLAGLVDDEDAIVEAVEEAEEELVAPIEEEAPAIDDDPLAALEAEAESQDEPIDLDDPIAALEAMADDESDDDDVPFLLDDEDESNRQ